MSCVCTSIVLFLLFLDPFMFGLMSVAAQAHVALCFGAQPCQGQVQTYLYSCLRICYTLQVSHLPRNSDHLSCNKVAGRGLCLTISCLTASRASHAKAWHVDACCQCSHWNRTLLMGHPVFLCRANISMGDSSGYPRELDWVKETAKVVHCKIWSLKTHSLSLRVSLS